jgi:hypothetical protein
MFVFEVRFLERVDVVLRRCFSFFAAFGALAAVKSSRVGRPREIAGRGAVS